MTLEVISEPHQSSFRVVSEEFPSSFRAVSEEFPSNFRAAFSRHSLSAVGSEIFCSFEQFQGS